MTIGIIGAGIAGLTAGRILAKAGHEVIIFEKSRGYGGRMATRYFHEDHSVKADHGAGFFTADSEEFKSFISELEDKELVKEWTQDLGYHDGKELLSKHPNRESQSFYVAPNGINSIGKYLSRWVDVKLEERVSGITLIGGSPVKKKQWMLNLQSFNTYELDAIIIATPGVQAYGLVQTAQDETAVRKLIREIDEITYNPSYSVMFGYEGAETPDWKAFSSNNAKISFVANESSKRDTGSELVLVAHSSADFARSNSKMDSVQVAETISAELGSIIGNWATRPAWAQVHYWRYSSAIKNLKMPFMELEDHPAPLALIGDYFEKPGVEGAFLSGYKLAHHWLNKFKSKR